MEAKILLALQDMRTPFWDVIMKTLSAVNEAGIIWILVTLALLAMKKTRRLGFICAISTILGLIFTNLLLKPIVARVRPYEVIEGLVPLANWFVDVPHDLSFPSGHATNALACTWVLFRFGKKKYGIPALIVALLICFSRLYSGVHYPTDILAGMAIGIISAEIAKLLYDKLSPKIIKKYARKEIKNGKKST